MYEELPEEPSRREEPEPSEFLYEEVTQPQETQEEPVLLCTHLLYNSLCSNQTCDNCNQNKLFSSNNSCLGLGFI